MFQENDGEPVTTIIKPEDSTKNKQNPALLIFENQILGGLGVSRKTENKSFLCMNCGRQVLPLTNGSYRNHCPHCLHSLHIDNIPGDRSSNCGGIMKPVSLVYNSKKGYQIRHKCMKCGLERVNVIAENTVMPDDYEQICKLSSSLNRDYF